MTQAQILTAFEQLPTSQQLDLLQAALDVLRKGVARETPATSGAELSLADAARLLRADYESDPELTCFTALDGEPIHAAR